MYCCASCKHFRDYDNEIKEKEVFDGYCYIDGKEVDCDDCCDEFEWRDHNASKMVSAEELLKHLDAEIERHKEQEGKEAMSWGRGFENGSMTEAIILRNMVRSIMRGVQNG